MPSRDGQFRLLRFGNGLMYAEALKTVALNRHLWAVKRFHWCLTQCLFPADLEVQAHIVGETHYEIETPVFSPDSIRIRQLESRLRFELEHEKCFVCGKEFRRESGVIPGLFYQCEHGPKAIAPFQPVSPNL